MNTFQFLFNPTSRPWIVFERDSHFIFFFLSNTVCFYTQRSRRLFICKSLIIANCVASSSSPSPVDFQHFLECFPLVKRPCRNHRLHTTTLNQDKICMHQCSLYSSWTVCPCLIWQTAGSSCKLSNVFLRAEQNTSVSERNNEWKQLFLSVQRDMNTCELVLFWSR